MIWWIPALGGFLLASIIAYTGHSLDIDRIELEQTQTLSDQKNEDASICQLSKTPTKDSDAYSKKNDDDLLSACISQLQQPTTCVPVYITKPSRSVTATCEQPRPDAGIDSQALTAFKLECTKDRNDLNAAKIWALGYLKLKQ